MTSYRHSCLLIAVLFLCVITGAASATDHNGAIEEDDYWTAAGNPHVINGTVTVPDGVYLRIGPGVEVHSTQSSSLIIAGHLIVDGDPGNEVLFTEGSGQASNALSFVSGGSGSLEYCIIEWANNGVNVGATVEPVTLFGTTIRDCGTGIQSFGGNLHLQSVTLRDNRQYGLRCDDVAPHFADSYVVVTDNPVGILFNDIPNLNLTTPLTVNNATNRGIWLKNCSLPTIDNVTLAGNASYGAFYLDNCGDFMLGPGNVIGGAGQENAWPVTIKLGSYPAAGCVIPASGNENNDIRVDGGISSVNGTWRKLPGVDYVLTTYGLTVAAGGALTVEPGVAIRAEFTYAYAPTITIQGVLTANGVEGQEIYFTGKGGIYFEDGGSGALSHWLFEDADSCITTDTNATGTITITDTEMRDSSSGLQIYGGNVRVGSILISVSGYGIRCRDVAPEFLDGDIIITGGSCGLYIEDVPNLELTTPIEITGASQAGVFMTNCPDPLIDNLTVTSCGGTSFYGAFHLDRCGTFTLGAGNVIGGEGQENTWPLTIRAGAFPSAECVIPTTGNINNDIRVDGGSSNGNNGTWRKFAGLDYVVMEMLTISAGDTLIVDPGVTILFDAATSFSRYGVTVEGTLLALGEAGQEIHFTRYASIDWIGLAFEDAGAGVLSHCLLEFATTAVNLQGTGAVTVTDCVLREGSNGIYALGGTIEFGSTIITGMSSCGISFRYFPPVILDENVTIENCDTGIYLSQIDGLNWTDALSVSGESNRGIYVDQCPDPTIDNIVVTDCAGTYGAFHFARCGDVTLGPGNVVGGPGQENSWPLTISAGSYPSAACVIPTTGNTNDDIQVRGGTSAQSGIWREFADLDYVVSSTGPVIAAGTSLTIEPGVHVRFGNYYSDLNVLGELFAEGMPGQEIVFTSHSENTWDGLQCTQGGSATLTHCLIEHATNGIYQYGTGTVALTDCTVRDGSTGIRATSGTVALQRTRITSNSEYGVYLDGGGTAVFGAGVDEWNDILDNGAGRVGRALRNGENDITAPYVWWSTTDPGEIAAAIYDGNDNASFGIVDFTPYCNEGHELVGATSVGDGDQVPEIPARFELAQGVPNPFNPATLIRFDTTRPSHVRLTIHDVAGRTVATLVDGFLAAGRHQHTWRGCDDSGRSLPSGVYFSRIESAEGTMTRKLALVR